MTQVIKMAKSTVLNGKGTSKIRFILVEAEISDGDIGQITMAIQNALRPPVGAPQRRAIVAEGKRVVSEGDEPEDVTIDDLDAELDESSLSPKPQTSRKRKPTSPEVLDLDLKSDVSLASFADQKKPQSHHKRFLVVMHWFKHHRSIDEVSASHIYTAYKHLKWPTGYKDFSQPLRDLKGRDLIKSRTKGLYSINHLGENEVDTMSEG
jgi:hypothetical protein